MRIRGGQVLAGILAGTLVLAANGLPAQAAEGKESALDSQKQKVLEAMDYLRDAGFSPMDIVDGLFLDRKEGEQPFTIAEPIPDLTVPEMPSVISDTGDALTQAAQEAGDAVKERAREEVRSHAQSLADAIADAIRDALTERINAIFGGSKSE